MGTTLTGTTPQDTYDSLIKVTDNGPLSGSLKTLTDGLGNDSALALSTGAASVTGTLAVSGNATFDTNTLFVDAANNRVGIGSITASHVLDIQSTAATLRIRNITPPTTGGTSSLLFEGINDFSGVSQAFINSIQAGNSGTTQLAFGTSGTGDATATERMRITSTGNVGIGNSSPLNQLDLNNTGAPTLFDAGLNVVQNGGTIELNYIAAGRSGGRDGAHIFKTGLTTGGTEIARFTTNGLTFNGDTAAANALDDYEEGTFSPIVRGSVTAGTATYDIQNGRYTKIGRLVQFEIYINWSAGTGAGNLQISNLPFTSASSNTFSSASISYFLNVALAAAGNVPMAYVENAATFISFLEMASGGGGNTSIPYDAAGAIQIAGTYSV
jgi:hypothetical protein